MRPLCPQFAYLVKRQGGRGAIVLDRQGRTGTNRHLPMADSMQEVYERNRKALFVYFYSLTGDRDTAEDLLQETFLICLRDSTKYDPQRASFYAWARTVGRNLHLGNLRRFGPGRISFETDPDTLPGKSPDPAAFIEREDHGQISRLLEDCLEALPEAEHSVVRNRFRDQWTLAEIGSALGITKRSVSRRYAGALRKLRDCLERKGVKP